MPCFRHRANNTKVILEKPPVLDTIDQPSLTIIMPLIFREIATNKKILIILIVIAAMVSVACICMPSTLLEYLISTEEPASQPGPATESPMGINTACQDQLADIITSIGYSNVDEEPMDTEYTLVTYRVSGDNITAPEFDNIPAKLLPYQENTASQEQLWQFVVDVVPYEYRQEVKYFLVFTDGVGGALGAVEQTADPNSWMLEMDIQDANNFNDLSTTLVHEITHLFTLNTSQVETDWPVFNNPDDSYAYEQGDAACDTYFTYEGCSHPDSYINQFFQRFWPDIYSQWVELNNETGQGSLENKLYDFYGQYADQFVSDYAATSPEEDIAESFMYFVFAPKPAGDTIAEEKILFFYSYPELVALRSQMMASLCAQINNP
jgi:hypothetical protein